MDLITQGVLGAAIGQAFYSQKLGRKALWVGGAIAILPDLDIFYGEEALSFLKYHRGYSHSLFFAVGAGFILGLLLHVIYKFYKKLFPSSVHPPSPPCVKTWIGLSILVLATHPLLDWFTSYGTQLLLPFTHQRFALDAIAIVDPFYTVILIISLYLGGRLIKQKRYKASQSLGKGALLASTSVLFAGYLINENLISYAKRQLALERESYERISSYPTLFQPFLRQILVEGPQEIKVGYISFLFRHPIQWHRIPKVKSQEGKALKTTGLGKTFLWFTGGRIAIQEEYVSPTVKRVQIMDMRYANPFNPMVSLWGIEAYFKEGTLQEPARFFKGQPYFNPSNLHQSWKNLSTLWSHLWAATLGEAPLP